MAGPRERTVAVVGGGVGGLTAAHELAERGFDVTVYEAGDRPGGKSRSIPVSPDERPLYGEHGFRFFPGFYRHCVDTMARIPCGSSGTVADNLVPTAETLLARTEGPERTSSTRTPDTLGGWLDVLTPDVEGLSATDAAAFAERLLVLLTSCDRRRAEEWDRVSWWAFVDADERSPAYREHLVRGTQALLAVRPEDASARTMGLIYLQLLRGQLRRETPAERVLDGPTSVRWIDPWRRHVRSLGASIETGVRATRVEADGHRVTGVVVEDGGTERRVEADQYVLAVPVEVVSELVTPGLLAAAPSLRGVARLETAWMNGIQFYLAEDVPLVSGHAVYLDAPWALTSVSQRQFWDGFDLSARHEAVEGVLSVIVSDWETPGMVHGKPAKACTRDEVAEEVWAQLQAHLNRETERLPDASLVDWFLDPAIVETGDGLENRSPLLVNTVGSLRHRPDAATAAPNLTLAADYVRTNADLASMESACEAGRRAANAVLERCGADATPAGVWPLAEPSVLRPLRTADALAYRLGLPHPGAVGGSVRSLARSLRPAGPA